MDQLTSQPRQNSRPDLRGTLSTQPVVVNAAQPGQNANGQLYLSKTKTQHQQDEADDQARKKAIKDLTSSWNDRLQLISLITTFFASVEAGLLQITTRDSQSDYSGIAEGVTNASLVGALVLHVYAAILSFVGAFFLIRFRVKEAKKEEKKAEGENGHSVERKDTDVEDPPIWSANPHLEQVGPFQRQPPTHLLARVHMVCIVLSLAGFVLSLLGIICFAWVRLERSSGIVSSVALGVSLLGGLSIFIIPQ